MTAEILPSLSPLERDRIYRTAVQQLIRAKMAAQLEVLRLLREWFPQRSA